MGVLDGKVAVVTGGYRGLGLGISRALQAAGAEISMWARNSDGMAAVAAEVGAQAVTCDVRDRADVDHALDATVDHFGRVDVMVANAGRTASATPFLDLDEDEWQDIVATNLDGVFRVAQASARRMTAQGDGGKIIVVSSMRAVLASPRAAAYGATKTALEGLVRSMALGLAPEGIQVNAVRPGWMASDMTEPLRQMPGWSDRLETRVPAGRWGTPADLGGIAVYLASAASDFHTGDVITIDGGLSAVDPALVT